ncbi:unnamed protein product [Dovyalis caffra]|uniref:Uncharacterized protein n=1 Tax=Dovyalis caffra TaxID=77055 RepID=A0AAV1S9L7_9ROSI|nr:unnamed protein product [Dovyalis caffra]
MRVRSRNFQGIATSRIKGSKIGSVHDKVWGSGFSKGVKDLNKNHYGRVADEQNIFGLIGNSS